MPDNEFSLHVDTDWKKQAQEEKRKLAEEQAKKAETAVPAAAPVAARGAGAAGSKARQPRELPQASFATLVNSVATQALYYLGGMGDGESAVNLDMAKHQLDTLGILENKTVNNLSEEERRMLDGALYEARSRFVAVASQYINF